MQFSARFLAFFVAAFIFLRIFSIASFAAGIDDSALFQTDPNVPHDIHTITQSVMLGMLSFVTCAVSGIDITYQNHECLGYNSQTGKLGYQQNSTGIMGMLASGISATYTKPLQTTDFITYAVSNFGIAKKALAADQTGFDQLSPVLNIWVTMRNVAYLLLVLIFVVTGFAIMLRAKIDPRTVMTIENQIPKLIIALVLISFSFAIAGLMVDLMWVCMFIVINLFSSLDPNNLGKQLASITQGVQGNPLDFANSINSNLGFVGIATQAAGAVKDIANVISIAFFTSTVGQFVKYILLFTMGIPILLSCSFGFITSGLQSTVSNIPVLGWFTGLTNNNQTGVAALGPCIDGGLATITSTLGGIIAFCIFTLALLFALAKLWWTLIKAYALFIVYVIFAPFFIMAGVLPGSKINFENWFRHIVAYLFVFPTAAGILLIGKVIMDAYSTSATVAPPLLGIAPKVTSALGPLLGFAIIMLLPQALTIVQDALAAPDIKYLPGIGAMLGAGTQGFTTFINKPWKRLTRPYDRMNGLSEGGFRTAFMNIPLPFSKKGRTIRDLYGEEKPGQH